MAHSLRLMGRRGGGDRRVLVARICREYLSKEEGARWVVIVGGAGQFCGMSGFRSYMDVALDEARAAGARGEVPVGAVIVSPDGAVVARAGNRTRELCDPTAHAEVLVIREACRIAGSERLLGHDLYVTLEPCPMCAAAVSNARIARLYYGAADPKSGGVAVGARVFAHPQCHHVPEVYDGIAAGEAEALLKGFFAGRR